MNTKHSWQKALSDLVTDPEELLNLLELDKSLLNEAKKASQKFPLMVTKNFIARMEKGNPRDPLLLQVLPLGIELQEHENYHADPLEEKNANPIPGLLHKYQGRILLTLTSACAVHCRYCFRRNFPYEENNPGTKGWELIFDYIRKDGEITEVILSGGDPLVMSDKLLKSFCDKLSGISHVKRLRFHTRVPVVLPERITEEFTNWISELPFDVVIVIHMNHPREMNDDVKTAMLALRKAGATMLNQSVLLKDINDDAEVLKELSESLFAAGVLPYYLHVLDKVQGTAHFDMKEDHALNLHAELMQTLPGYLVPKLAREEAGKTSKTILI